MSGINIITVNPLELELDQRRALAALGDERREAGLCIGCGGSLDCANKLCGACWALQEERTALEAKRKEASQCLNCGAPLHEDNRHSHTRCLSCESLKRGRPIRPCPLCSRPTISTALCVTCQGEREDARKRRRAQWKRLQELRAPVPAKVHHPCSFCGKSAPIGEPICQACLSERRSKTGRAPLGSCLRCNDPVYDRLELCEGCRSSEPLIVSRHLGRKRAEARAKGICVDCLVDYAEPASLQCNDCTELRQQHAPRHFVSVSDTTVLWK